MLQLACLLLGLNGGNGNIIQLKSQNSVVCILLSVCTLVCREKLLLFLLQNICFGCLNHLFAVKQCLNPRAEFNYSFLIYHWL